MRRLLYLWQQIELIITTWRKMKILVNPTEINLISKEELLNEVELTSIQR